MDTLNTQETVWKEEHPTVTNSMSTQGNMSSSTSQFNAAAGADSREPSPGNPEIPTSNKSPSTRRHGAGLLLSMSRRLATLAITLLALLVSIVTWDLYVTAAWTRDGRIRVQVASVAPEVSGKIKGLYVVDNQFVHKGDILYQIDPFDFDVTLRTTKAALEQREADNAVKQLEAQ